MAKRKRIEDRMLLATGERIVGKRATYIIEKVVGTGAFAAVYSAKDISSPQRYAVKEYFQGRPSEQNKLTAMFKHEQRICAEACQHPLVPEFIEAFSVNGYHYIVTEFVEGTSLDDIIIKNYPLPREWILKWSASLCDVLEFLHSKEILHFDLKPANIRIDTHARLKLFDFGSSIFFGKRGAKEVEFDTFGTDGYLAPELSANGLGVADPRTDIFALGCIMFEMLSGDSPDQQQLNRKSVYVTNALIHKPHADLALISFINKALSYNTNYRYIDTKAILLEMTKIAPPVLLIDTRTVRIGTIKAGQTVPPQRLIPYNAGGGTLRVQVTSSVPWISIKTTSVGDSEPAILVQIIPNKIPEFNHKIVGFVEITSVDQFDESGTLVTTGEKWKIPCTITLTPRQGSVLIPGHISGQIQPIWVTGKSGQPAKGSFDLHNAGSAPVHVFIARNTNSESVASAGRLSQIVVDPESLLLESGQSATIKISSPRTESVLGDYKNGLEIRTSEGYKFSVPISVRQQGSQPAEMSGGPLSLNMGPIDLDLPGRAVVEALIIEKEAKNSNRSISANGQSSYEDAKEDETEDGLRPLGSLFSES